MVETLAVSGPEGTGRESPHLEFKLLGPVEVVIDGLAFSIAAPRQEVILALLLLAANRVVSVSRMIDALWADDPPRTARSQVHIIVSALRRLLGEGVIVTRPPGYSIHIPEGALDLTRFEQLAAKGARAAAELKTSEAVELQRSALALWRGPAMEDVESDIIRAAAKTLNEERISVLQDCIDLELQMGRHSDLIGRLTGLVAEHSLDERFRSQLMLAYYRAGRQADALEVARQGRELLAEELGLDPGEQLSDMERAILTRDPEIDLPASRNPPSGSANQSGLPSLPRQLPRATADFAGRTEVLRQIAEVLSGGVDTEGHVPVVLLTGRGGTGKTALAIRAAHRLRDIFPDGQLFVQAQTDMLQGASGQLDHLLRSVGVHPETIPSDLDGRSALYRSWLADRRVLVVVDGAQHVNQITPFLPGSASCAAIITSRQRFSSLEGIHQIQIGPLDDPSAFDLLASLIGANRAYAEKSEAQHLIQLCEAMPLALRIAAAKLAARPHWTIGHMVRRLLDEERRLDELDLEGSSVRATLAMSYGSLERDARSLFRRLSILGAGDFSSWVSAPLLDQDFNDTEDLLQTLVSSHLVEAEITEDDSTRFRLHDLVRIYARECLVTEESATDRLSAVSRFLGCWLSITTEAHRRIYGGDFGLLHGCAERWELPASNVDMLMGSPTAWFRRERSALVAAIFQASQLGLDELCWDLAVTSATLFESGSYSDDWHASHSAALDVVRRTHNKLGEAALLHSLGNLELGTNDRVACVHFESALAIFDEVGTPQGRALALMGLAIVRLREGNYREALEIYNKAVTEFQAAGDLAGEAHSLKVIAQIHADWSHYGIAEQFLASSLEICKKLGSQRMTAQTNFALGELHLRRGNLTSAADIFESVLSSTRQSHDSIGQAYALCGIGNARRRLGDFDGAERALETAMTLSDLVDDRLVHGRVLLALAELHYDREQNNLALARVDEAIRELRELGVAGAWHGRALELLGRLHERAGRNAIAEHAWRSAAELTREADPALAAQLQSELARLQKTD